MKYKDFENGKLRELTPEEVCAMYHFHDEYAELGLGAIAYYKGLSSGDKNFVKRMVKDVVSHAAQQKRAPDAEEAEASQSVSEAETLSTSDSVMQSAPDGYPRTS